MIGMIEVIEKFRDAAKQGLYTNVAPDEAEKIVSHIDRVTNLLGEFVDSCPACNGNGAYLEYNLVEEKNLWNICQQCKPMRRLLSGRS